MKKLALTALVVALGLGPALVAAQTTSPTPTTPPGRDSGGGFQTPSSTPGTPPGGSMPNTPGMPPAPPSASPSTEPSPGSDRGKQFTNKADCERAGGKWQTVQNRCDLGG